MKGWWKCPSGRASNVRWARLTFAARGMLATIEDAADGSGEVPIDDTFGELVAVLGAHHGAEVAHGLVQDLVAAGFIAARTDPPRLVILDAPAVDASAEEAAPAAAAQVAPAPAPSPAPSAPNPLAAMTPAQRRRLKHKVEHRVDRFARIAPGTTWEAILSPAHPEHHLLADDGRSKASRSMYRDATGTHTGTERDAYRDATGTLPGRPSPQAPLPEKDGETEKRDPGSDALARSGTGYRDAQEEGTGTHTGTRPVPTTGTPSGMHTGTAPRCSTTEATGRRMAAAEVWQILRGQGRLRLTVTGAHEVELERVLADVATRDGGEGWNREGLERLAGHIRSGHLATGKDGARWTPTIGQLRGSDGTWTRLLSLYDEAAGCARCVGESAEGDDSWAGAHDVTAERLAREEAALRAQGAGATVTTTNTHTKGAHVRG